MVVCDTHSTGDADRDSLAPDIALYSTDDQPGNKEGSFMRMSIFVELKTAASADPFLDPMKKDPLPRNNYEDFERSDLIPAQNRGQIASYAAAILGTQFRLHVFSVSICGHRARFIRWDRAGAIVSGTFDYVRNPHLLADFFYRYSRLDRLRQGYDPTLSAASEEEVKIMEKAKCDATLKANSAHYEFRKLMVPDRDDPSKESPFLISYPPRYDARSPFSRATRGMLAFDLTNNRIVYLKDYWRPNVSNMQKEGEIYRILKRKNVRNIAPFGMGNDVRGHQTLTQSYVDAPWAVSTKGIICLSHYRMTLDAVGRPLTEFHSSHEFISAIADAMEGDIFLFLCKQASESSTAAHDDACFDARILHRDISVGNILFTEDNKGMLIDWDLCANMDTVAARRPTRTASRGFIHDAIRMLICYLGNVAIHVCATTRVSGQCSPNGRRP
jgi:hypothetical protein